MKEKGRKVKWKHVMEGWQQRGGRLAKCGRTNADRYSEGGRVTEGKREQKMDSTSQDWRGQEERMARRGLHAAEIKGVTTKATEKRGRMRWRKRKNLYINYCCSLWDNGVLWGHERTVPHTHGCMRAHAHWAIVIVHASSQKSNNRSPHQLGHSGLGTIVCICPHQR